MWPFKKKEKPEEHKLYLVVVDENVTAKQVFDLVTLQYKTPSVRVRPSEVPESLKHLLVPHE